MAVRKLCRGAVANADLSVKGMIGPRLWIGSTNPLIGSCLPFNRDVGYHHECYSPTSKVKIEGKPDDQGLLCSDLCVPSYGMR